MSKLSPQAVRNVQRILDDIARRRLEERDRDAVGSLAGANGRFSDRSLDEQALVVRGQFRPVSGGNGHGRGKEAA